MTSQPEDTVADPRFGHTDPSHTANSPLSVLTVANERVQYKSIIPTYAIYRRIQ